MNNFFWYTLLIACCSLAACHPANEDVKMGFELQCEDSLLYDILAAEYGHQWNITSKPEVFLFQIIRTHDIIEEYSTGDSTIVSRYAADDILEQRLIDAESMDYAANWIYAYSITEKVDEGLVKYQALSDDSAVQWTVWVDPDGTPIPIFRTIGGMPARIEGKFGNASFDYVPTDFKNTTTKTKRSKLSTLDNVFDLIPQRETSNLEVVGKIVEMNQGNRGDGLTDVRVTVLQDSVILYQGQSDSTGGYNYVLPLNYDYRLVFEKQGFETKSVDIDLRHIPFDDWSGGFLMDMDISLFEEIEGLDFSRWLQPIGVAKYDKTRNSIQFDFPYTQARMDSVNQLLGW